MRKGAQPKPLTNQSDVKDKVNLKDDNQIEKESEEPASTMIIESTWQSSEQHTNFFYFEM